MIGLGEMRLVGGGRNNRCKRFVLVVEFIVLPLILYPYFR
jgi:hypothetical protein